MGIFLNLLVLRPDKQPPESAGGPFLADLSEIFDSGNDSVAAADNVFPEDFSIAESDDNTAAFVIVDKNSILNSANPLSTILPTRDGLIIYKIQKGDTLSKIAANFGISLNTLFWANKDLKNFIKPGQEIVILPVSGVLHQVEEDETVNSIAELYGVSADKIFKFNKGISRANLKVGSVLVIPDAKSKKTAATGGLASLPSLPGYFIIPTTGWNWGRLHYNNGIDIANACGTPVYAAAEGLVTVEKSFGWNGGYGHLVEIEHPNGVVTRYAHTQKNSVSVGDYVVQGDLVAYIGNTGNTHGPTGCHLHFEVHGARNSFGK